jgi:hypothetical protein
MKLKDAMFYYNLEKVISSISKRQKMLSSSFNYEEFLEIELSDESAKILREIKIPSKPSEDILQKIEIIILLLLRIDPEAPDKKLGWRSNEKLHSLSGETIKALIPLLFFPKASPCFLIELTNLLTTKKLPEEMAAVFVLSLIHVGKIQSLQIFDDIDHHNIKKIDDELIRFITANISFYYYNLYMLMGSDYRREFWKWISLRGLDILKNPAARFFETKSYFEDAYKEESKRYILEEIRRRRRQIEVFSKDSNGEYITISKIYNWSEEYEKITAEIRDFPRKFQRLKVGESNNHHMFFPSGSYDSPFPIFEYRRRKINKIRISKLAHEQMNSAIHKFSSKYEIPILTNDFLSVLRNHREPYRDEYLNFLGLMQAFCEICLKLEPTEEQIEENNVSGFFMLSARFYDLFILQHEFINLKTIR